MLPSELQLSHQDIETCACRAEEWIAQGTVQKSEAAQVEIETDAIAVISRLSDLAWEVSRRFTTEARAQIPVVRLRSCLFAVYDQAGAPIPIDTPGLDRQYEAP